MKIFDKMLDTLRAKAPEMEFQDIIREARDLIGIRQYRAGEFLGIPMNRIKNLETGYFRSMPRYEEILALSQFYEISFDLLKEKAEEHVSKRVKDKKIRIMADGRCEMRGMLED